MEIYIGVSGASRVPSAESGYCWCPWYMYLRCLWCLWYAWYIAVSIVSQHGVVPLTVGMLQAQLKPSSRSAVVTTKLKP